MAEVTSNGFYTDGLNPYIKHSAGNVCYLTGGASIIPAYTPDTTTIPVTNLRPDSIAGFKYFNFDIEAPEGYLSLNDKMGDVLSTVRGKLIFAGLMAKMMGGKKGKDGEGKMEAMGFEISADMMTMMNGFTVLRLFTLMGGMMDVKFTKEELLEINAKLNKIKRKDD